jgi:phosphohistidine phosphatase
MDLYLIRHAEAVPQGQGGIADDADRPLTENGRKQCLVLAKGLQERGIHFGVILTSPLLRARQTAEGMLQHWVTATPELRVCDELAFGGKRRKVSRQICDLGTDSVALVGHEPDLGRYAAWLIGNRKVNIDLAKAGVAYLRCEEKPGRGAGTLIWLVTPEWLGK